MIKGIDVSHWQGSINWPAVPIDFAIIKCSEGVNYVDVQFARNKSAVRKKGIPLGYYHFARGFSAKTEAQHFMKSVGDILQGEFLVLDYEIHVQNPVAWCKTFLDEVSRIAGFKPLIYLNSATLKAFEWQPIVDADYGLWLANYYLNVPIFALHPIPKTGAWQFMAMWQWTSRGRITGISGNVDLNVFYGDKNDLKKYGKK